MPIPGGSTVRYVTPQQVREVLSPDGDNTDDSTAAAMDDPALETAITEAADEVDGRLGARYSVPFGSPAPSMVVTVTRDIAAYRAWLTFRRDDPVPSGDPVAVRYGMAEQLLAALSNGSAELPSGSGVTPQTGEVAVVNPYEGNLFEASDFALAQVPSDGRPAVFTPGWRFW